MSRSKKRYEEEEEEFIYRPDKRGVKRYMCEMKERSRRPISLSEAFSDLRAALEGGGGGGGGGRSSSDERSLERAAEFFAKRGVDYTCELGRED